MRWKRRNRSRGRMKGRKGMRNQGRGKRRDGGGFLDVFMVKEGEEEEEDF